jgi:hypothetical protein
MQTDKPGRNVDLDIVKGVLVLVMLLYHCASVSEDPSLKVILRKIDFIHYAFLAITGLLCGYHYHSAALVKPIEVQLRLLIRAGKLFGLFCFANTIYFSLGYARPGVERLRTLPSIWAVFRDVILRPPGDLVAFEVLCIIAGFIFLAAILIRVRSISWLLAAVVMTPMVIPGVQILFIAMGCAGMLVGILAQKGCLAFQEPLLSKWLWIFPVLLVLRIGFVPSLCMWVLSNRARLFLLSLEVLLWFCSAIWIVKRFMSARIQSKVVLLGRYTLFCYMFQMLCARFVHSIFGYTQLKSVYSYGISVIIVGMVTYLMTVAIDGIRKAWPSCDKAYRIVFQ